MGEDLLAIFRSPTVEVSNEKILVKAYSIFDVESWWDDTALVDSAQKLNNDLAISVIINQFKFSNII